MAKTETASAPSFSAMAKAAGLPVVIDRDTIEEFGPVTWVGATTAEARNPTTGAMGNGLMVEIVTDDGNKYLSFIGNVALLQVLGTIDATSDLHSEDNKYFVPRTNIFPFRARIVKSGRTWVFKD